MALLKRLKKSKGWLHALCVRLFEEQGLAVIPGGAFQVRAVDATTVKEPGPSGSLWRLHYSVGLPSLTCDFFKLTGVEGPGTGESLAQFPIRPATMCWPTAGIRPRGGFATCRGGRAADCACQYGVAAAAHGSRAAVRPAGRGVVGQASGGSALLGDDGRGRG